MHAFGPSFPFCHAEHGCERSHLVFRFLQLMQAGVAVILLIMAGELLVSCTGFCADEIAGVLLGVRRIAAELDAGDDTGMSYKSDVPSTSQGLCEIEDLALGMSRLLSIDDKRGNFVLFTSSRSASGAPTGSDRSGCPRSRSSPNASI